MFDGPRIAECFVAHPRHSYSNSRDALRAFDAYGPARHVRKLMGCHTRSIATQYEVHKFHGIRLWHQQNWAVQAVCERHLRNPFRREV